MTEDDFEALRAHLSEVRPIFDEFCAAHGFVHADPQSIGRYPRIRIEREEGELIRVLELWMEYDDKGRGFERFRPDLPYELSAGVSIIVPDAEYGTRFDSWVVCFVHKPFHQVPAVLRTEMEKHLVIIERWTGEYLKAYGRKTTLSGPRIE
jgi:hypothetical protein